MIYKRRADPNLGQITGEEDTWKLVVPTEYQGRVLEDAHLEVTTRHLGGRENLRTRGLGVLLAGYMA